MATQPSVVKRTYSVQLVKGNYYDRRKPLEFYLLEDGYSVARVKRRVGGHDLQFAWYTDRAIGRFQDSCDSISMEEACEAMLSHDHKGGR